MVEQQNSKGGKMQTGQGFRQAFKITSKAARAGGPGKAAFDDPAFGQQDKALLGVGQLDDDEADAMGSGVRGWLLATE